MHKIARWNYFISLVFSVFFVVTAWAVSNYYQTPLVSAADSANNIRGWGYSSSSGWISLNSLNDGACKQCQLGAKAGQGCRLDSDCLDDDQVAQNDGTCVPTATCPTYGLSLVSTDNHQGEIKGHAWSSSLGYMCFGSTCTGTPPSGLVQATYICKGKICQAEPDVPVDKVGIACTTDADCGDIAGSCRDNGDTPCDQAELADVTGWAKILNQSLNEKGWISLGGNVNSNPPITPPSTYGLQILFNQCFDIDGITPIPCTPQLDKSIVLSGWAWHQAGGSNIASPKTGYGAGWLCFNKPECKSESEILFPYVYGQGGDVFSRGSIQTMFPPPVGRQNAQYLVHVEGNKIGANFRTACADSSCKEKELVLNVPSSTTVPGDEDSYNFKLGRFDFKGLATPTLASVIAGTPKNSYGFEVVENSLPIDVTNSLSLDGKVYVVPGPYAITNPLTIKNGAVNGAGTVIIRGDLIVDNDIKYATGTGSVARKQLASVVWFVLGDVKVSANVKEMAGTFIVLGKRARALCTDGSNWGLVCPTIGDPCSIGGISGTCTEYRVCNLQTETTCADDTDCGGIIKACKPKYLALNDKGDLYDGFGKFDSCNPQTDCGDNQLVVNGSVFARQFKLNRTYVDVVNKGPAENFKSSGRLQLNPPPGMEDLSNGLPTFSRR